MRNKARHSRAHRPFSCLVRQPCASRTPARLTPSLPQRPGHRALLKSPRPSLPFPASDRHPYKPANTPPGSLTPCSSSCTTKAPPCRPSNTCFIVRIMPPYTHVRTTNKHLRPRPYLLLSEPPPLAPEDQITMGEYRDPIPADAQMHRDPSHLYICGSLSAIGPTARAGQLDSTIIKLRPRWRLLREYK
ncbi:hypothetical protein BV25DRAFT_405850 [Artomyces pyxidatus]|uniref:Uncharacterized protein n=1 Tax=Artomyces pyxidatus TaxID=48021 RepID=A0ACB8T4K6_9AGAM|nr:hypothetical protein BV25DRAFT_405850 [Artomyces pyxidatus]